MTWQEVYQDGEPAPWVRALAGKSGVYLIKESGLAGQVLYVGESHTGRLKKTLLRHFQRWKGPTAGPKFKPGEVEAAVIRTPPDKAVTLQNAVIQDYEPKLNTQGQPEGKLTFFHD